MELRAEKAMKLVVAVVIPSVGRPSLVRETVDLLRSQTRPADRIIIVGSEEGDVLGLRDIPLVEVLLAPRGLCSQRNRGLKILDQSADVVIFFDDDFIASSDYIEVAERILIEKVDLVGITGRLIADGINTEAGYSVSEAVELIRRDKRAVPRREYGVKSLYGCNMVLRSKALESLSFDENLPLYGWQEDIDFTTQLSERGPMLSTTLLNGVHLGVKGGRISGRRFGYSQIANPFYLLKKRTMPSSLAFRLVGQNLMSNLLGSFNNRGAIDRRGRLIGNGLALWDVVRGRANPRRVLDFK